MNSIHPPKLLRWMDEEFDRVIETIVLSRENWLTMMDTMTGMEY